MCSDCHNYYLDCRGHRKGCNSFKPYSEEQYRKHYKKETGKRLESRREKRYVVKDDVANTLQYYNSKSKRNENGVLVNISKSGIAFKSNAVNLEKLYKINDYICVSISFTFRIKTVMLVKIRHITNNICGGMIIEKRAQLS